MLSARKGGDEEIVESCMKMQEVINCAKNDDARVFSSSVFLNGEYIHNKKNG